MACGEAVGNLVMSEFDGCREISRFYSIGGMSGGLRTDISFIGTSGFPVQVSSKYKRESPDQQICISGVAWALSHSF